MYLGADGETLTTVKPTEDELRRGAERRAMLERLDREFWARGGRFSGVSSSSNDTSDNDDDGGSALLGAVGVATKQTIVCSIVCFFFCSIVCATVASGARKVLAEALPCSPENPDSKTVTSGAHVDHHPKSKAVRWATGASNANGRAK